MDKHEAIQQVMEEIREMYRKSGMGSNRVGYGERPAVIVVDFQKGMPAINVGVDMGPEIEATRIVLDKAREKNIPIVFMVTGYDDNNFNGGLWTKKMPCLAGWRTDGEECELDDRLGYTPNPNEHIVVKRYCSSFLCTGLASFLNAKQIDTLIITGCSTSGCIRATTTDAMCNGFRAILPRECINDRTEITHEVNLMDMDTRFCDVVHMEEVLEYFDKF